MSLQTSLRLLGISTENDYGRGFEEFAKLSLLLSEGEQPALRLERARTAFAIGDYGQSREDAGRCLLWQPGDPEALRLLGLADLALVAQRAGELPPGPGLPENLEMPTEALLDEADRILHEAAKRSPHDVPVQTALPLLERLGTKAREKRRPLVRRGRPSRPGRPPSPQ